jgi:hypothetical protein
MLTRSAFSILVMDLATPMKRLIKARSLQMPYLAFAYAPKEATAGARMDSGRGDLGAIPCCEKVLGCCGRCDVGSGEGTT